jgi:hypothetical protein
MGKRKRVDEFELPAALGNAVVAYFGPRKFAKFSPAVKADIANACHDCAKMLQAILADDRADTRRTVGGAGGTE